MAEKPPPPRATRPDLPRKGGPNRRPAKPPPQMQAAPPAQPPPDDDVSDIIADAVGLGYKVVQENLRQGRLAADRHKAGQYQLDDVSDDVSSFVQRMVELSRDLAATGFDLIEVMLRDPRLLEAVAKTNVATKREKAAGKPAGRGKRVLPAVKVVLTGRAAVVVHQSPLERPPEGCRATPYLQRLAPLTGAAPPIRGSLRYGENDVMLVRIHVPDQQPPGTYQGAVVNRADDMVLMVVAIRVAA